MDATVILDRLGSLGVSVEVTDDRLRLVPGSRVPPDLVDELKAHKDQIIATIKLRGYRQKYSEPQAADQELEEISTRVLIDGYILLWATVLCDLVVFYRDEDAKRSIPAGFVRYSLAELTELFGQGKCSSDRLRVVHAAKKLGAHIAPS